MSKVENVSLRIAALLLLREGEITFSEIEALPLVEDRDTALKIAGKLLSVFNVEVFQRKALDSEIGLLEEVIRLKDPTKIKLSAS